MTKLLGDNAPDCSKEQKFENYFGRKIAIDASMHIYQFLVKLVLGCKTAVYTGRGPWMTLHRAGGRWKDWRAVIDQ